MALAKLAANPANISSKIKIGIIGLGYVGLPLAIEFAKKYVVMGFDINQQRIDELLSGNDITKEADADQLRLVLKNNGTDNIGLSLSSDESNLRNCNIFIITVQTPVNQFKSPDLSFLLKASATVGGVLKRGDIVIYESTIYPGGTEEDCVPVLEHESGFKYNVDFYVGYSPERINPGDKVNTLTSIKKITSGSLPAIADIVDELYASIITAGTYKAPSIKVAEASKVIENAQRDLNISFVNELALIFDRMGIDTNDVLDAAATKWNFLKYKPGLVGGHCIGVDPYYLAHKAESLGYYPQVILSGRRVNDNMGMFVANKVVKLLIQNGYKILNVKALLLGISFKENCPDIRNTKAIEIYRELKQFGIQIDVYDPWADKIEVQKHFNLELIPTLSSKYDAIILAVAHDEFKVLDVGVLLNGANAVVFDTKAILPRHLVQGRL